METARGGIGKRYDAVPGIVDADRARAYAAATNDEHPAYADSRYAPPVFGVVPTWEALVGALADQIPADALPFAVHLAQDMHYRRPLVPGMHLATVAESYCRRVSRAGTRLTIRLTSRDDDGEVLEIYTTLFFRGLSDGESEGPAPPDHAMTSKGASPLATRIAHIDDDQTFRYRDASGDAMPIHVDDEFARRAGFPGIVVHGLCAMAMCTAAVLDSVGAQDPGLVRRLAVRFSTPARPGSDLTISTYEIGDRQYAFRGTSDEISIIKDGRVELAAP